jgi:hypothetical protein
LFLSESVGRGIIPEASFGKNNTLQYVIDDFAALLHPYDCKIEVLWNENTAQAVDQRHKA